MAKLRKPVGTLVIVRGDQLDLQAAAFDGYDNAQDAVWMAEVAEESTHVLSSKQRTVMFLAAMRHFALALQQAGRTLQYTRIDADGPRWPAWKGSSVRFAVGANTCVASTGRRWRLTPSATN